MMALRAGPSLTRLLRLRRAASILPNHTISSTRISYPPHSHHTKLNTSQYQRRYSQQHTSFSRSTIFALASGHGKCGVAVIRISGPTASTVIRELTRKDKLPEPRVATLTGLYHPSTREMLDRGIVLWYPG